MTNQRAAQVRRAGTPGPEGSVAKLAYAEENQRVYELCMDLLGNEGMLYPAGYPMIRPEFLGMGSSDVHKSFLRVRANSIEGGRRGDAQHSGGARPGPPRRRAQRQGAGLEGRTPQLARHRRQVGHRLPAEGRSLGVEVASDGCPLGVTKGAGSTDAQISMAKGQRMRKRQPVMEVCPVSTSPVRTIWGRVRTRSGSGTGIADSSAAVYGWVGRA